MKNDINKFLNDKNYECKYKIDNINYDFNRDLGALLIHKKEFIMSLFGEEIYYSKIPFIISYNHQLKYTYNVLGRYY